MTVAELIAKLQELPQELEARIYNDEWDALFVIEGVGVTRFRGEVMVWMGNTTQAEIDSSFGDS